MGISQLCQPKNAVSSNTEENHQRAADGHFIVPLPMNPEVGVLGESRSGAVRRFLSLERLLHMRGQFDELSAVIREYYNLGHAEEVPQSALNLLPQYTFYLPMQVMQKECSTTTKVRAVFDAFTKTSTGVSLNDRMLVGSTVHSTLLDVLLRFRAHRVALTNVSRMYRTVLLTESDRDFHRFVWRECMTAPLQDYKMTRVTFGVAVSSFIANVC